MESYENIKNSIKREGYVIIPEWLQSNDTEVDVARLDFNNPENRVNPLAVGDGQKLENKVRVEGIKIADEKVLEYVLNTYINGNGNLLELGEVYPEDTQKQKELVSYLSKQHKHHDLKAGRLQKFRESNPTRFDKTKSKINIKDLVTEKILNSACTWCTQQLKVRNPDINSLLEIWAAYNYFIFALPPRPENTNIIQYFEEENDQACLNQIPPLLSKLIIRLYEEDIIITKTNSRGHLQLYNKGSFITPHHDGKYSDITEGSARIAASFIYLNDHIEGKGGELTLLRRSDDTPIVYKPKFGDLILLDCYYDVCINHTIKPTYWERYGYVSFNTVSVGDEN